MITVYDIVKEYLNANGFDGLMEPNCKCGCETKEIAPCGEINGNCLPAYKWPGECGYDFVMKTVKPE